MCSLSFYDPNKSRESSWEGELGTGVVVKEKGNASAWNLTLPNLLLLSPTNSTFSSALQRE